jgi:hypothetical protein
MNLLPTGYLINVGDRVIVREDDTEYTALLLDIDVDGYDDTIQLDDGTTKDIDRSRIFPTNYENKRMYEELKDELNLGICEVTFTKKDGTERVMSGTLNFDHIPNDKQPKGTGKQKTQQESIAVFDVMKEDWRSFRISSVINFERLTGPGCGSDKKKEVKDETIQG